MPLSKMVRAHVLMWLALCVVSVDSNGQAGRSDSSDPPTEAVVADLKNRLRAAEALNTQLADRLVRIDRFFKRYTLQRRFDAWLERDLERFPPPPLNPDDGPTRTVWIIDCSGLSVDTLPFMLGEVRREIQALTPEDQFGIVFSGPDGRADRPVGPGLRVADEANQQAAMKQLELGATVVAFGEANWMLAFERAMGMNPGRLSIHSPGIRNEEGPMLLALAAARPWLPIDGHQYFYRGRSDDPEGKSWLQQLAEASGGEWRFVRPKDLGAE